MRILLRAAGAFALCLVGLVGVGAVWGKEIGIWLAVPSHAFESRPPPRPPDYDRPESWSALPERRDAADVVPPDSGAEDRQASASVDCFYVHPTTYFFGGGWNAATHLWITNEITDSGPVAGHASAFNGVARVFAPRYRQMTISGYWHDDVREHGLGLAYGDVSRAFRHYVEQRSDGRPFFLASHSQGSGHLQRLIREEIEGTPLEQRLIAAYVVGMRLPDGRFERGESSVPLCEGPEQTGCIVAWQTFLEGGQPDDFEGRLPEGESNVCTNPLHWRRDSEPAGPELNLGAIPLLGGRGLGALDRNLVGARCRDGILWIDEPRAPGYDQALFPGGNYHAYDYNLFYMNVRANAELRAARYLADRGLN